jgi:anti-sigma regulatory factor (Ser/Thr protein kinase)
MPPDVDFHHEAFLYAGGDEFLAGATAFIRDAVAGGEPVLVAVRAHQMEALRTELGDLPGVVYEDMPTLGRNPARIIPAWQRFVAEHARRAPALRGIGEPIWAGRDAAELVECRIHEALLNVAFRSNGAGPRAGGPGTPRTPGRVHRREGRPPHFRLMCPYDTSVLDPRVIEAACGTHPFVVQDGTSGPSDRFAVEVADLLGEPLPEPAGIPAEIRFDRSLVRLRRFVAEVATRLAGDHLDRQELLDVVLTAEELGANSVRHGGGGGVARIWREGSTLLCEVRDRGRLTDPLAGRHRPDDRQIGGRGLWLVNQVCDLLQLRSSPSGTTARAHFRLTG